MSTAEQLLQHIEQQPSTLREGCDSLALLYQWRQGGGDGPGFMAALQSLQGQGLVEMLPGDDMRLRLSVAGFERLDALLPADEPEAVQGNAVPETDENAWRAAPAGGAANVQQLSHTLLHIFAVLGVPAGHAVAADTLAKIWLLERQRGGDLRLALDALAAAGLLQIQRGTTTAFLLTPVGEQAAANHLRKPS